MTTKALKQAYSLTGAAEAWDVSPLHLKREIRAGKLRAKLVGNRYRIAADDMRAWFDQLPDAH